MQEVIEHFQYIMLDLNVSIYIVFVIQRSFRCHVVDTKEIYS